MGQVKVDEVSGIPEVPQIRQGQFAREAELQRQNVQPPTPPDQVEISQAARFAAAPDQAARVEKLKAEVQKGISVQADKIATALQSQGVVR